MSREACHRIGRIAVPLFALITASVVVACRPTAAPPPEDTNQGTEAAAQAPAPAGSGVVALELKNESVDEVLQQLAKAAGKAFIIDPDAQVVAHCARITLLTGGNMPAEKALDLVREGLEASGFSLAPGASGGLILKRDASKPLPATCMTRHARETDTPASEDVAKFADKFIDGVHRISDTEYEITRAAMDLLLGNESSMMRVARVIPQMRDGQTVGMKLFAIRSTSPFATLGLKNGDVVTSVNGQAITSPDAALAVYEKLQKSQTIEVAIERRGAPLKITYRIKG